MELFHLSPYYGAIMTLFIVDIVKAPRLKEIYGSKCQTMSREGWFMINNHPLKKVKVRGIVKSLVVKEFDDMLKNFIVLYIDDSSGIALNIGVKVEAKLLNPQLLQCEGRMVEVSGEVNWYFRKEIACESLKMLENDLDGEIRHWKECFASRENLKIPWKYEAGDKTDVVPPFMVDGRLEGDVNMVEDPDALMEILEIDNPDSMQTKESTGNVGEVIEIDSELDSDIELLPNLEIKLITETQLLTEILIFLLQRNCQPTSLNEIYNHPAINTKLNDHLIIQMTVKSGSGTPSDLLHQKYQLFHYLRHKLVLMKLIITTKSQKVYCDELFKLQNSVFLYLNQVKSDKLCFNVENFCRIYCNQNHIKITYKILNGLIEWLIREERHLWRYDRKRLEWLPIA